MVSPVALTKTRMACRTDLRPVSGPYDNTKKDTDRDGLPDCEDYTDASQVYWHTEPQGPTENSALHVDWAAPGSQ